MIASSMILLPLRIGLRDGRERIGRVPSLFFFPVDSSSCFSVFQPGGFPRGYWEPSFLSPPLPRWLGGRVTQ